MVKLGLFRITTKCYDFTDLEPNHFLITENTDCWPEKYQKPINGTLWTLKNCSAVCKNWGNFVHKTSDGTCKCVSALATCEKEKIGMNLYQANPDGTVIDIYKTWN